MTSQPQLKMTTKNEIWTLSELFEKITHIVKPKFNRDKVWIKNPVNSNKKAKANYEEFLEFLFKIKNSVSPISLGVYFKNNERFYHVIDGNNRINAIGGFLNCPYDIFSKKYYIEIMDYIDKIEQDKMEDSIKQICKDKIKNLTYKELSTFSRLDDIIQDKSIDTIEYNIIRDIEKLLITIQKKLRSSDGLPYDTSIKLLINQFENGTNKEYCEIFEDMNKYSNTLSQNELLAAMLFEGKIIILNEDLKCKIIQKIKEYYDNRGKDEVLETYTMALNYEMEISPYDFIVGFENYCSEKYEIFENFKSEGISLFFKIFGYLYKSIQKENFTEENVNDFIQKILFSCDIISNAYKSIMPKNINDNIFNVSSKNNTCKLVAKNTLAILFISVISNQLKISKENIIKEVKKAVIYNTLCSTTYLKNVSDENKEYIKSHNKLEYVAGTSHIDNMCKTILETDTMKIFNITKEQFEKLLNECLNSCLNEKEFKNKESSRKRRTLNLFDKILVSNFYNKKMSNFYLTGDYSIEHISPFSSKWEENTSLDIDRLGNLFPTLDSLNKSRQNTNLEIYYKSEYIDFTKNIDELLPKNYDIINSYKDRKTNINDTNKYNEYCSINEKLYIKTLVDDLYSL
jgi:hypothetical protein